MIDSSKLLSRVSANRNLISRKVLVDLTIVKRDAVKIDNLLKERLVLTKVREGIMRQQRENEMRREREQQLEEKRDDESANVDPKKKNQPKSLLGNIIKFVLGGFLKVIGRLTLRILPRLPFLLKTIVRFTRFFGTIIRGTFNVARLLIKFAAPALGKASLLGTKVFFGIANVILGISASITPFIASIIGNFIAPFTGALARKGAAKVTASVRPELVENLSDVKSVVKGNKGKFVSELTDRQLQAEINARKKFVKQSQLFSETDQTLVERLENFKKREKRSVAKEVRLQKKAEQLAKSSVGKESLGLSSGDPKFFQRLGLDPKLGMRGVDPKEIRESEKLIKKIMGTREKIPKFLPDEPPKVTQKKIKKRLIQQGLNDADAESLAFKASTDKNVAKEVAAEALLDEVNAARKTVKASKLVGKKGLSKLLFNIGGEALEQSVKQSIKASIGVIPILGDLIGVLLDVFLFGEPVGRALFKGIGSFALGALLGGVGTFLGGPVGTLIGSIIGGIGGDILGGIAYDLFFGRKPQAGGYSTVTGGGKEYLKGVSKARAVQNFNEGGVVREYEPPKQVISDRSSNLQSLAFYEKTQVGREVMIPIPIPINNNKNQGGGENIVIHSKNVQKANSFSQLYRRG